MHIRFVQVCLEGLDDDEKDRKAMELAATRIQAISRGKSLRKNNDLGKAAASNTPPRRPNDGGEHEHLRGSVKGGLYCANTTLDGSVSEGSGGAPSAANRSGDVSGGAPVTSAEVASSADDPESAEVDRKTVTLIASLVDERIMVRE